MYPRLSLLFSLLCLNACTKQLPTPATPAAIVPQVAAAAPQPPENHGRVTFDAVDGPAIVELVLNQTEGVMTGVGIYGGQLGLVGGVSQSVSTRRLCTTPCTADLPYGQHEIRMRVNGTEKSDIVAIDVTQQERAVRVDLGDRHQSGLLWRIGFGTSVAGGTMFATGLLAMTDLSDEQESSLGFRLFMGSMLATTVGGAVMMHYDRTIEQQPGVRQWTIAPTIAQPGVAASYRW